MKTYILLSLVVTVSWNCLAQNAQKMPYEAGFRTYDLIDSSRLYKPDTPENHNLHFRPVDLDVWYPSSGKTTESLYFRDLFGLFEKRAVN